LVYLLKIIRKTFENRETISFVFKQPGLRKIRYKAGQYLTLMLNIEGRRYKRCYSLSSSPSIDDNLSITIKRVPNGIVSNYLADNYNEGDEIEVMGPTGDFTVFFNDIPTELYLWAGGSGITPIFSILNEVLYNCPLTKIHLLYSNSTLASSIFSNQLISLSKKFVDRFNLYLFFTQEKNNRIENAIYTRLSQGFIEDYISDRCDVKDSSKHFICGPSQMMIMVSESLKLFGVDEENIISEDFELNISNKDLEDILEAEVNLFANNCSNKVLVKKGQSILDAYLNHGIELPYFCQTGSCNKCKAKLIRGKSKMLGTKNRTELNDDEILLCCSFPLSETIEIVI
jgi:ring-1,2-phenylacetyl-CoA epoxidase subunit PaaE